MRHIVTTSPETTQKLGEDLAKEIKKGSIVALYGELGTGKTTFVQGLARGLGITKRIISPTFVIIRKYNIEFKITNQNLKSIKRFYHIDLYRVYNQKDLEGLGLEEIFQEKDAIVVIEWSEKLGALLPEDRVDIQFEYISENERKITIAMKNDNIST